MTIGFLMAAKSNNKPQTNADRPSRGLLRPCFARLLALLVGQPDAFGTGASPLGQYGNSASVDAPAAKRSGWVRAKPELRSSRKAPRAAQSAKVCG